MTYAIHHRVARLSLLSVSTLLLVAPASARADDAHTARAAVIVTAPEADPFLGAYLFEVAATLLRAQGFEVAPPTSTASKLEGTGKSPLECATDDACARALARDVFAPSIVFAEVVSTRRRRASLKLITVTVVRSEVRRSAVIRASGREGALAETMEKSVERFASLDTPCRITFESAIDAIEVRLAADPEALVFPVFLDEGTYSLVVDGGGRPGERSTLTCRSGRHYRISVE